MTFMLWHVNFRNEFCMNIYIGLHQHATIFIKTKFLSKGNSCFLELTITWS